ncbi:MAG: NUDIX hydrolase [Patescibacteria group bacterium]
MTGYASAVVAIMPDGTFPMVKDYRKHPEDPRWKFPGGKSQGNETAQECAARELDEETGVKVDPEQLVAIHRERRRNRDDGGWHDLVVFQTTLPMLQEVKRTGNHGEHVALWSSEDLLDPRSEMDVFAPHLSIAKNLVRFNDARALEAAE